jgi:coenzyme F420-0:L-glutamate ligase/coenzyme F420-1:gamma-L-glutamate ligase
MTPPGSVPEIQLIGLRDVPEVQQGADVAGVVQQALAAAGQTPRNGDVLVVTHKIVSKAEGQLVDMRTVAPSALARSFAETWGKDPRHVEVVLRESVRIVRMDHGIIISQTPHGFICANAGVDASNVPGDESLCLLPRDPDASARALRESLVAATGADIAVVITDSFGRPWRNGIVNIAIGVAGIAPLVDYRGQPDDYGRVMSVSVIAVADEIASAAELVMGKVSRCPLVLVRGYSYQHGNSTAREIVMDRAMDLFP